MSYLTVTLPGVVRGPHEHRAQTDLMAFVGPGDVDLYLWDARPTSTTRNYRMRQVVGESNRQLVLIPPGVVHAFRGRSKQAVTVLNFPNRLYAGPGKVAEVDEVRHEEDPESPFVLD